MRRDVIALRSLGPPDAVQSMISSDSAVRARLVVGLSVLLLSGGSLLGCSLGACRSDFSVWVRDAATSAIASVVYLYMYMYMYVPEVLSKFLR